MASYIVYFYRFFNTRYNHSPPIEILQLGGVLLSESKGTSSSEYMYNKRSASQAIENMLRQRSWATSPGLAEIYTGAPLFQKNRNSDSRPGLNPTGHLRTAGRGLRPDIWSPVFILSYLLDW